MEDKGIDEYGRYNATSEAESFPDKLPPVPDEVAIDKRKIAKWYWDQIYGEYFEGYSDSAFEVFRKGTCQLAEQFSLHVDKEWSKGAESMATVRSKTGDEIMFNGHAEDLIPWMRGSVDLQMALRMKSVVLRIDPPMYMKDNDEVTRFNRHISDYLQRVNKAYVFDKFRRCEDAYKGNVERLQVRDRDINSLAVIRNSPDHVESIHKSPKGHYLLMRSSVLVVGGTPQAHPIPKRALALHYAVLSDKAAVVRFLLSQGASMNIVSECGATAMDIAIANNCRKVLQILLPPQPIESPPPNVPIIPLEKTTAAAWQNPTALLPENDSAPPQAQFTPRRQRGFSGRATPRGRASPQPVNIRSRTPTTSGYPSTRSTPTPQPVRPRSPSNGFSPNSKRETQESPPPIPPVSSSTYTASPPPQQRTHESPSPTPPPTLTQTHSPPPQPTSSPQPQASLYTSQSQSSPQQEASPQYSPECGATTTDPIRFTPPPAARVTKESRERQQFFASHRLLDQQEDCPTPPPQLGYPSSNQYSSGVQEYEPPAPYFGNREDDGMSPEEGTNAPEPAFSNAYNIAGIPLRHPPDAPQPYSPSPSRRRYATPQGRPTTPRSARSSSGVAGATFTAAGTQTDRTSTPRGSKTSKLHHPSPRRAPPPNTAGIRYGYGHSPNSGGGDTTARSNYSSYGGASPRGQLSPRRSSIHAVDEGGHSHGLYQGAPPPTSPPHYSPRGGGYNLQEGVSLAAPRAMR
eukprot:TRINITY_DN61306_c0_g1_i1.p1 TRINITY_DN61306_c0_g1~~TRINITY_DN61306_c0_g1_i1.p1  ORF type:complete len:743 (+),score=50.52 TRINITY_DN61306_c0_g1_i1:59-2287(+)